MYKDILLLIMAMMILSLDKLLGRTLWMENGKEKATKGSLLSASDPRNGYPILRYGEIAAFIGL